VSQALKHYQAATQQLTSSHEDQEVARKGINDLHRLWKEVPGQPVAEVCLGYLYDWLGDYELAVHHWRRYLEVGSEPAGIEEARRGLGRYTRLQVQ
jgi:hypothetical protein